MSKCFGINAFFVLKLYSIFVFFSCCVAYRLNALKYAVSGFCFCKIAKRMYRKVYKYAVRTAFVATDWVAKKMQV